ncbi:MAG: hypothetical protein H6Q17_545 [Bacteroidetes bacterium]|nr:hypothetical protein [Bacteroidota bacterium]
MKKLRQRDLGKRMVCARSFGFQSGLQILVDPNLTDEEIVARLEKRLQPNQVPDNQRKRLVGKAAYSKKG